MKTSKYFFISIALYFVSMFLPVFGFYWEFMGIHVFFFGLIGLLEMKIFVLIPWLANLTYLSNLLLRKKSLILRSNLSALTILFSLFAFAYKELPFKEGSASTTVLLGPAFLCWFSSFVFLALDQVKEYKKLPRKSSKH